MTNRNSEMTSELQEKINNRVEYCRDEIVKALSDLVKIPSISPKFPGVDYDSVLGYEGDVSRYIGKLNEESGAYIDFWEVEHGRTNVVAHYRGIGHGKSLIYNGHVDVVPPGQHDKWKS